MVRLSALIALCIMTSPALAQTAANLPRTHDGHPDLQGIWTANYFLPLEKTALTPSLTLPEAEAKKLSDRMVAMFANSPLLETDPETPALLRETNGFAVVRGERRTRALISPPDGIIPYTPKARRDAVPIPALPPADNPEERTSWERCLALQAQPPMLSTASTIRREVIQTLDHIVIYAEYGGEARIIPFADHHGSPIVTSTLGDSIAHWDGDTLVIETVGLPARDRVRALPTLIVGPGARVIERLTRLSVDELLYQFTVEDSTDYAAPWLAEFSLYRTEQPTYEFACHEGNYGLANILKGARAHDDRALAAKAGGGPASSKRP